MNSTDFKYIHTAIEVAQKAPEHGNHPFGVKLVDENKMVSEGIE